MAAATVEADPVSVPSAVQPITNGDEASVIPPAKNEILDASDVTAKENQGVEVSDTQPSMTGNNATSLPEVTKLPAEEPIDINASVVPDVKKLEDTSETLVAVDTKDDDLKKFEAEEANAIHSKDTTATSTISDSTTVVAANEVVETDTRKSDTEAEAVSASTSKEATTSPLSLATEVTPSAEESTPSMEPSTSVEIESEPVSGSVAELATTEAEAPVAEQEMTQMAPGELNEGSHANEDKITEPADTTPTKVDILVEDTQAIPVAEEATSADSGDAKKEAEELKPTEVEDKAAEPEAKEASEEAKVEEPDAELQEQELSIQVEETEATPVEATENHNASSLAVDDSAIAVEVVAPTPALVDDRQLEESDAEDGPGQEDFQEEASSTPAAPEDVATEGTATPRPEPEVEATPEPTEDQTDAKEEVAEESSVEAAAKESPIDEEATAVTVEAPTEVVRETHVVEESVEPPVEIMTKEEELATEPKVEEPAPESVSAAVEEATAPGQEEEAPKAEPAVEETATIANVPPVHEELAADGAAVALDSEVETTVETAPVTVPEVQPTQEETPIVAPAVAPEEPAEEASSHSETIEASPAAAAEEISTGEAVEFKGEEVEAVHEPAPSAEPAIAEPVAEASTIGETPAAEEAVVIREEAVAPKEEAAEAAESKEGPEETPAVEADSVAGTQVIEEQPAPSAEAPAAAGAEQEVSEKEESAAEPVAEGASAKEEPAVEDPVKTEPVAEQTTAKEEPIKEEPSVEPIEEPTVEEPVKEETVVEEPAKKESVTEEPTKEDPPAEEPTKEESTVESVKEGSVGEESAKEDPVGEPATEKATPIQEEAINDNDLGLSVAAPAAEEPTPVAEKPAEETASEEKAVEDIPAQESIATESIDALPVPAAHETPVEEPVTELSVLVEPSEQKEELTVEAVEKSDELASEGAPATALAQETLGGAPVPMEENVITELTAEKAVEEPAVEVANESAIEATPVTVEPTIDAAEATADTEIHEEPTEAEIPVNKTPIEEPEAQNTPIVAEKAEPSVLLTIPSAELADEPAAATVEEQEGVADDEPPVEEPAVPDVEPVEAQSTTQETDTPAKVNENTPVIAKEESIAVTAVEPPLDESVGETSVADTTTETIIVPDSMQEKEEDDSALVVKDISVADEAEAPAPEKLALSIPDEPSQAERPKSPWTPSFQVTTIGHGVSLPAEEDIPSQALDDAEVLSDAKSAKPEIVVEENSFEASTESAQPSTEAGEPDSASLSWTPSYSVHSQGSPSPSHASLEPEAAARSEDDAQVTSTSHEDVPVPVAQAATSPDASEGAEHSTSAETVGVEPAPAEKSVAAPQELLQAAEDLRTSHEEKEPTTATTVLAVVEQETEPESQARELGQDESVPAETVPIELETTYKSLITEVASMTPPLEQEHPTPPSWVPSYSISKQGSPLHNQTSLPAADLVESEAAPIVVATEIIEKPVVVEDQGLHVDSVSSPPTVVVNGDQPQEAHEEPAAEDRPSTPWTPSYSVTRQGPDILEETQIDMLAPLDPPKDETVTEKEPRRSLSEEMEDSRAFSPTALIGAGVAGGAATLAASAVFRKSAASLNGAEEPNADAPANGDATPSESRGEKSFPTVEIPDENKLHAASLPRLDENNTLDTSSLSPDTSPISSRRRLESTTSSRLFPGGWFSNTSKIPDERTSLEVAQGVFSGAKQGAVEETLASPTMDPATPVREESSSDKRRWCVIM